MTEPQKILINITKTIVLHIASVVTVNKGQKIKEVCFFDEKRVSGSYTQSKAMGTQAVLDAVRENGLNACVVHPSGILVPEESSYKGMKLFLPGGGINFLTKILEKQAERKGERPLTGTF